LYYGRARRQNRAGLTLARLTAGVDGPGRSAVRYAVAMFMDRLSNTAVHEALPARVRRALEYLRATDLDALAPGRHEVDGDRIFALVQDYRTRPAEDCRWEAHRQYIDVQHVVSGDERMGYVPIADTRERDPYDPERDVAFFEPGRDFILVRAGMFAVFWPTDVHAPQAADGPPSTVRKVVVKVAVDG
jgi:YhcH/YjgK/YiaL family protein